MQIYDYIRFARRWVPIALALALVFAAAAYGLSKYVLKPVYTSTVTLQVSSGISTIASISDPTYGSILAQTESAVAEQGPIVSAGLAAATGTKNLATQNRIIRDQAPSVSCQTNGVTALFSCSVTANSAVFARHAANRVAAAFIHQESVWTKGRYQVLLNKLSSQEIKLRGQIKWFQGQFNSASSARRRFLQGQITLDQAQYSSLLAGQAADQQAEASQATIVNVVTPALLPVGPSSPHPTLNAVVALFLVFLLATGFGLARYKLNDAVGGDEELKQLSGLPILGSIPYVSALGGPAKTRAAALVVARDPRSLAAEALRVIRTGITLSSFDRPAGVLLVTSSVQQEGKSTVAANLAIAFAESGISTILVDFDMRRPSVAKIFGTQGPGLTNLLVADTALQGELAEDTPYPGLRVVPTGPLPPNPAEMIGSGKMRSVMQALRSAADLVIVDSPPLLAVADAAIAATLCDAAVVVVRPDTIKRRMVTRSVELLHSTGIRVAGIIVNTVTPVGQRGYYSAYRSSYHTYGYGYGPDGGPAGVSPNGASGGLSDELVAPAKR